MSKKPLSDSSKRRLFGQCQRAVEKLEKQLRVCPESERAPLQAKLDEERRIRRSYV